MLLFGRRWTQKVQKHRKNHSKCRLYWTSMDVLGSPWILPAEGFEPPTYGLQNRCTTTVLSRRRRAHYSRGLTLRVGYALATRPVIRMIR
jgi:hypothetical protein